jgi:hypothetical protein
MYVCMHMYGDFLLFFWEYTTVCFFLVFMEHVFLNGNVCDCNISYNVIKRDYIVICRL